MSIGSIAKAVGVGALKGTGKAIYHTGKTVGKAGFYGAKYGLKGAGKVVRTVDGAAMGSAGKMGEYAVDVAMANKGKVGDAVKNVAKGSFTKIEKGEGASLFNKVVPYKLSNKAVGTVMVGGTALSLAGAASEGNNVGKLGKIEAGELSNMVSFTRSPQLERLMDAGENDPKMLEQASKTMFGHNTHGAEGDLVFALHNLRNK